MEGWEGWMALKWGHGVDKKQGEKLQQTLQRWWTERPESQIWQAFQGTLQQEAVYNTDYNYVNIDSEGNMFIKTMYSEINISDKRPEVNKEKDGYVSDISTKFKSLTIECEPKVNNGIAKYVLNYDAEGNVTSVQKFDADGNEVE